jgi:hypothetical protein
MSIQVSSTNNSMPFVLSGDSKYEEAAVIAQDAARTVPLAQYTVMSRIAATRKWVPMTNTTLTATNGSQKAQGIYIGDTIAAATLVAGDTTGAILLFDAEVDASQVVFDRGSTGVLTIITKDSVATMGTSYPLTIEDALAERGIIFAQTTQVDAYEN